MTSNVIPSLSDSGWIIDNSKVLNAVMSYYILTDSAQSLVFQDNLINLPITYYKNINDPDTMASEVKNDLDKLLSRFFPGVDVECVARKITDSRYGISLYAAVVDNENNRIELSKVIEINSDGLRKVIEVSNKGTADDLLLNLN